MIGLLSLERVRVNLQKEALTNSLVGKLSLITQSYPKWGALKPGLTDRIKQFVIKAGVTIPRELSVETPEKYSLPYENVVFQSRDGINLSGWHICNERNLGTVIFAHGYRHSKAHYLEYARWIWQAGYNVFMFDFRGHGYSEGPKGTSIGYMERLDIHGAVDYLLSRGAEKLSILGVSMGASAAIMAASENENLQAVVADSPYAQLYRSISTQISRKSKIPSRLAESLAKYAVQIVASHHNFAADKAHPLNYTQNLGSRPLLLIHGEADTLTKVINSHLLYESFQGRKQLWSAPGVGHVKMYFAHPEKYQQKVLAFLKEI